VTGKGVSGLPTVQLGAHTAISDTDADEAEQQVPEVDALAAIKEMSADERARFMGWLGY